MRVLVTGSGGFLGQAVCRALRGRDDEVVGLSRNPYPALDAIGVSQCIGDVSSLDTMLEASRDCDAVMHLAAKAGAWGSLRDYYDTNVTGTDNAIAACAMNEVPRLVYASTPSVVHAGGAYDAPCRAASTNTANWSRLVATPGQ